MRSKTLNEFKSFSSYEMVQDAQYHPPLYPHYHPPTVTQHNTLTLLHDDSDKIDEKRHSRQKSRCCCSCLPVWAIWVCWLLLSGVIVLCSLAAVVIANFKVPQVRFDGPTEDPNGLALFDKNLDNTTFTLNTGLKISVVNENFQSAYFESINAIAYYPTSPDIPVGGGMVSHLTIGAHTTTHFTFPFQIDYDASRNTDQGMLVDIASKCGLLGGRKQDITIHYDLTPVVRVWGFPFSVTIRDKTRFPCPIKVEQMVMSKSLINVLRTVH
ncbi:hypothetical protein BDF14DRAFT_1845988 [Spinellus fusiger]|nr:hypothetical protein BDF14DRAFT_1845988 [Spinellus fusiger]